MILGEGTEGALITELVFWTIALSTVVSAIAVVQIRDLFRASLFLIVTLLGVAGLFILLSAEFIAGVQLMIYVGAISVLPNLAMCCSLKWRRIAGMGISI